MLKLIKFDVDSFLVTCPTYGVHEYCNTDKALRVLYYCGIEPNEIDYAFTQLIKNNDNLADFGVNKMLTFTAKHSLDVKKLVA